MMNTYHARQPERYIKELVPMPVGAEDGTFDAILISPDGAEHKFQNKITAYRIMVDMASRTYQTFTANGLSDWVERRPSTPLTEAIFDEIQREVDFGHLIEQTTVEVFRVSSAPPRSDLVGTMGYMAGTCGLTSTVEITVENGLYITRMTAWGSRKGCERLKNLHWLA
jgi:hypothetical protein